MSRVGEAFYAARWSKISSQQFARLFDLLRAGNEHTECLHRVVSTGQLIRDPEEPRTFFCDLGFPAYAAAVWNELCIRLRISSGVRSSLCVAMDQR